MTADGTPRPDTEPNTGDVEALRAWLHDRHLFDGDHCQHGTYTGGVSHGQPYAMCEREASALASALPALGYVKADPARKARCHWDECPHGENCTHAVEADPARPDTGQEPQVVAWHVSGRPWDAPDAYQAAGVDFAGEPNCTPLVTLPDALAYAARQQHVGPGQVVVKRADLAAHLSRYSRGRERMTVAADARNRLRAALNTTQATP